MSTSPDRRTDRSTDRAPADLPWLLVARREVLVKLTDKSFLVGTLITLLLVIGFIGFQIWSEDRTDTYTVAATSDARATAELLEERVPDVDGEIRIELFDVDSDEAGVRALEDEDADVLLRPADDGWTLVGADEVDGGLQRAAETVVREAAFTEQRRGGRDVDRRAAAGQRARHRADRG